MLKPNEGTPESITRINASKLPHRNDGPQLDLALMLMHPLIEINPVIEVYGADEWR